MPNLETLRWRRWRCWQASVLEAQEALVREALGGGSECRNRACGDNSEEICTCLAMNCINRLHQQSLALGCRGKVNWYLRSRLYLHFNRKSQRGYVLKYAPNFCSESQAMGLHRLQRGRSALLYNLPVPLPVPLRL